MTTKEAILHILANDPSANKYRLSKAFKCSNTTIHNYVNGEACMSATVYEKFLEIYPEIEITDIYTDPSKDYTLGLPK